MMAWGNVASEALKTAKDVFERLVKLSAVVERIDAQIIDFRDDQRKRQAAFEERVERRLADIDAKLERKSSDIEARVRDAESRLAKVEGKVAGALAEAYAAVLLNKHNDGSLPAALLGNDQRVVNKSDGAAE